jgi:PBSX family phage terminase large subunit
MLESTLTTGTKTRSKYTSVFSPLPWQVAPWRDKAPVLLLTGSAGGGKSRLAAEKIHGYCLKYPRATWLIMRKAREWTGRSIVSLYNQSVVAGDPRVQFNKSEGTFYYSNGSVVYSGGMLDDRQREAVRSIGGDGGLDGAWLEEANAFTRLDYEEVVGRVRHTAAPWQQIILTTNPGGSLHWIKKQLIEGREASVYYSGAKDNPNNSPAYLTNLEKLSGAMYERLVLGKWVQAEGAVYDMFDHRVHVTERQYAEFKTFGLAMDEGYTNPAVILLIGVDSDDRWHIFREYYERGKLQETVVQQAKEWFFNVYKPEGAEVPTQCQLVAVDEAAAGLIADLRNNGIPAEPAKGKVFAGISAIQDRLKVQPDGKPRLTVDPSCINTINEFESYVWKRPSSTGVIKDEPQKENDHAMDAIRYFNDAFVPVQVFI